MDKTQIDEAVKRFEDNLVSGSYVREISPNSGRNYHKEYEESDHKSFQKYVTSDLFHVLNRSTEVRCDGSRDGE